MKKSKEGTTKGEPSQELESIYTDASINWTTTSGSGYGNSAFGYTPTPFTAYIFEALELEISTTQLESLKQLEQSSHPGDDTIYKAAMKTIIEEKMAERLTEKITKIINDGKP